MTDPFVHLHCHSDYSLLDGMAKVEDYAAKAKELGQLALGITDHGTVTSHSEFYHACRKAEINPVLGSEMYFVEDAAWRPVKGSKDTRERDHVTVLAKGRNGHRVLNELSTESHRRFYSKPLIDRALLE